MKCSFTVSVQEKNLDKYKSLIGNECRIEDDDGFSMEGYITEMKIHTDISCATIETVVTGKSIQFDKELKYRVFQDEEKKPEDIVEALGLENVSYQSEEKDAVSDIIIQSKETDWNFLKKFALYLGKNIYLGEKIIVGNPEDSGDTFSDEDVVDIVQTISETHGKIKCKLKKKLKFGTIVRYDNKEYLVDRVEFEKKDEEYVYTYFMSENIDNLKKNDFLTYQLKAKVIENEDEAKLGRVQVVFEEPYEDVMQDNAMWIPVSSIYASGKYGLVCIPSKGDSVDVLVYDGKPIVLNVLRTEAFDDRYKDCETKSIFIDDDTYLEINGENFVFDNTKYKCVITKESADISMGDKCVVSMNGEKVSISTGKGDVEIATGVKIKCDGVEIDGNSKFSLSASQVNIKGKSGVSIN